MSEEMSRAELAEEAAAQQTCIGCAMGLPHMCAFGEVEEDVEDFEEKSGIVVAVSSGGWHRNFSFENEYSRTGLVLCAEEIDVHIEGPIVELSVDAFTHRVNVAGAFDPVGMLRDSLADLLARVDIHAEGLPAVDRVEAACEVMHDAYEKAAVGAGWETQAASRKPWADVPEANKVTMRAAVAALIDWLEASYPVAYVEEAAPTIDVDAPEIQVVLDKLAPESPR